MRTNYRNKFFCISCSVTLTLMAFNSSLAENWPCFRGPSRQGISHEKDIPVEWSQTSNILWKRPIPGEGWSSPVVFDDRVFVTAATDGGASFRLLCLESADRNHPLGQTSAPAKAGTQAEAELIRLIHAGNRRSEGICPGF